MMSKAEERELLEQIKALLDKAEPDGYVATAFEGCVEQAEQNIEDDFCFSVKKAWVESMKTLDICQKKLNFWEQAARKEQAERLRLVGEINDAKNKMHDIAGILAEV